MAVKGAKTKRAVEIQEKEVLNTVKDMTFDTVTKELAGVQVELQKTLAELSGKLAEQFQRLETVEESIRLKQLELKELKDIDAEATKLDQLQAEIEETKEQWEADRAAWKRDFEEQKSEARKQWARETEDHQYQTKQKNMKQDDALALLFEQKERANKDKQERLEKDWSERETILKKAEQELAELRSFKEQAPEMIKKAVNQEVAIANNSLKKEYEHKMQMAQKDAEMAKALADAKLASDSQTITKLQAQIDDLNNKMEQAQQRVTDISTKALDSASGRATTEALQRMMETEKMSGKSTK